MQSPTRAALTLTCLLLSSSSVLAQDEGQYQPRRARTFAGTIAQPLAPASSASPAAVVSEFLARHDVRVPSASIVVVGDAVRAGNGIRIFRLAQRVDGLAVHGVSAKAAMTGDGALTFLSENFVSDPPSVVGPAGIAEAQALSAALRRLYPNDQPAVGAARRDRDEVVFDRTPFFHDSPRVRHVAVPLDSGRVTRGLLVETWSEASNLLHETLVGSRGEILEVVSRTSSDRYNVFVEAPDKSSQVIVDGPAPAPSAPSPQGWLFPDSQNSTHIVGNNANAYLDADRNNRSDPGGTSVTTGAFLATADLTSAPTAGSNREVAVQNLFFLNNVIHDELYRRGFNETAGNFQEDNFGKGGRGSDSVLAEAQDGSGLDNANFATPPDGRNPRMQMFLWSGPGPTHLVEVSGGPSYAASGAEFGPDPTTTGVAGLVVAAVDAGGASTLDGCEAISTALAGRIALVDRGNCDFTLKAQNAQAAGAVALIVANNQGTNESVPMGGTNRRIRIPSVMIGKGDGTSLRVLAESPTTATVRTNPAPPPQRDGSVDADIVYHEYGHGLTWRMIGDMDGPLAGAIGEGASDALAILMNGDDRLAEYSSSNPAGIRRNPYAGYPRTYKDVVGESVHADGEILGAIVWRMSELFGGSGSAGLDRLKQLFVDGMNYTPAAPAFEDMRNGMLMSAANSGNTLDCALIWDAFAQFGVGVGASGTATRSGTVTIVESFATSASCTP